MSDAVLYTIDDGVATITINQEQQRNAISPEVMDLMNASSQKAKDDPEVRVVVVTGAGDRAFCAGGNLSGGMTGDGFMGMHNARGKFVDMFRIMKHLGKPIVARVNGYALGGGFGLMLNCDIVIAVSSAKVGTPEINIGLFPMMIMPVVFRNMPRKVGMELILTGRKVLADEALQLGLVNKVVDPKELDAAVKEMTDELKGKSQAVLKFGRDAFYAMQDMSDEQAWEYMIAMLSCNTMLDDAAEGVMAFMSKRPPEWKDR